MNINFIYEKQHTIERDGNGYVQASPAFTTSGRLYVIFNDSTDRNFYIGTAANLQNRFIDRIKACRDLGFNNGGQLENIFVWVVRLTVNDNSVQPNDQGMAYGIDVEHLLIRTYTQRVSGGVGVRNITKITPFLNVSGQNIQWELTDQIQVGPTFGQHNYNLAHGNAL